MKTSNYSLICENVWTHHLSLRISGLRGSVPQPEYLTSHLRLLQLRISADLSAHTNNLRTVIALIAKYNTTDCAAPRTTADPRHKARRSVKMGRRPRV
jgi:hypothetical protein